MIFTKKHATFGLAGIGAAMVVYHGVGFVRRRMATMPPPPGTPIVNPTDGTPRETPQTTEAKRAAGIV